MEGRLKTKQKNFLIRQDGPKRLPKKKICVNLTNNKNKVIELVAKQRKWRIIKNDDANMHFDVVFCDLSMNQEYLSRMKSYQKINHFPGILLIARKHFLACNLRKMQKQFPQFYNFFPDTFCLPSDRNKLMKEFQTKKRIFFIVKPDSQAEGRGIFLVRKFEQIKNQDSVIVQKYISNPLLIDGYKFDLRVYVLITSVSPLTIFVYKEGLARFSTNKYIIPNDQNYKNLFMHLTNYAINKKNSNYKFDKNAQNGHKRCFESIWKELRKRQQNPERIFDQIKKLIVKTIASVQPILEHIYNSSQSNDYTGQMCFDLLGFDVILDSNYKPWVLEVNHAPSLNLDTPLDKRIKTKMINSLFDILNLKIQKRKEILRQIKSEMKEWILNQFGKRKTVEEKQERKRKFLEKELSDLSERVGDFELVYPSNKFQDEPYQEFMNYARRKNKEKTGVMKNEANKIKRKQNVEKVNKKINMKRQSAVQSQRRHQSVKYTTQYKHKMINNSI